MPLPCSTQLWPTATHCPTVPLSHACHHDRTVRPHCLSLSVRTTASSLSTECVLVGLHDHRTAFPNGSDVAARHLDLPTGQQLLPATKPAAIGISCIDDTSKPIARTFIAGLATLSHGAHNTNYPLLRYEVGAKFMGCPTMCAMGSIIKQPSRW